MKNSKEQKPIDENAQKHNLRLVWESDDPKPRSICRLEFIGELMPYSDTTIPVIEDLPWLDEKVKDKSNN